MGIFSRVGLVMENRIVPQIKKGAWLLHSKVQLNDFVTNHSGLASAIILNVAALPVLLPMVLTKAATSPVLFVGGIKSVEQKMDGELKTLVNRFDSDCRKKLFNDIDKFIKAGISLDSIKTLVRCADSIGLKGRISVNKWINFYEKTGKDDNLFQFIVDLVDKTIKDNLDLDDDYSLSDKQIKYLTETDSASAYDKRLQKRLLPVLLAEYYLDYIHNSGVEMFQDLNKQQAEDYLDHLRDLNERGVKPLQVYEGQEEEVAKPALEELERLANERYGFDVDEY